MLVGSSAHPCLAQMASVAERFGMSVQRLIDLNADLADITDDDFIKDGQDRVCMRLELACFAH